MWFFKGAGLLPYSELVTWSRPVKATCDLVVGCCEVTSSGLGVPSVLGLDSHNQHHTLSVCTLRTDRIIAGIIGYG